MPETAWIMAFVLVAMLELLLRRSRWKAQIPAILGATLFGMALVVLVFVVQQWNDGTGHLFHRLLFLDKQAVFFKIAITVATLLTLAHIGLTRAVLAVEFYVILPVVVLGLYLMTMAVNGLSIYLAIELVSIGSYLFTAFGRGAKPAEGSLKYLLFGALSSAVMLYGLSLLYGMAATLDFTNEVFVDNLAQNPVWVVLVAGFLVLGGVFFKLSLVPFQSWVPDVYEALPLSVAAFLSVAPKAAALLVLMRLLSALPVGFQLPLAVVSLASILVGNTAALWQNDLRRLLAYSGVAQAGFMVVGLVAFNKTGFEGTVFYLVVYLFANLAAFLLIDLLGNGQTDLRQMAGKGGEQPFLAMAFLVVAVSLVGLPPTAGFTAKLLVFSALWESYQTTPDGWLLALLVLGLLNAVVSLAYYFKLPFYLFFREKVAVAVLAEPFKMIHYLRIVLVFLLVLPIILLFFKPNWLLVWINAL
ncbi:MAG: NADH-quinone oxidoreductase subunit N [Runella slithyformis]|nr:MAG: NADH-quinone oxidoreductase subunit N [Runella slithyformis]